MDYILSSYVRISYMVVIQEDETNRRFGKSRGSNKTRIRRRLMHTIVHGAALLAAFFLREPVTILPLELFLYGKFSHIAIPQFSILPQIGSIVLTMLRAHGHNRGPGVFSSANRR
jgi:hypothetical protein